MLTPTRENLAPVPSTDAAPPEATPQRSSRRTPERPCLNCGDPTVGNFCPSCGQRKVEVRVSFRRMILEAIDDQFSLNSALPRTLRSLFFRPGHLTREYAAGRIARYIPPFRLYLVSSLLFFLVLSLLPEIRNAGVNDTVRAGGLNFGVTTSDGDTPASPPQQSAAARVPEERNGPGWLDDFKVTTPSPRLTRLLQARADHFNTMAPDAAVRSILGEMLELLPTLLFLMMPVFALVLKLLYVWQKRFYVEHFVFALHVHAFAFLLYTLVLLVRSDVVGALLGFSVLFYLYFAMKSVYGQGWIKTGVKFLSLGIAYQLLGMIVGGIAIFVSILLA